MTELTNDDDRRKALVKHIFKEAGAGRLKLTVTVADGGQPIVVALEHEPISAVMGRVEMSGGSANSFVEMDDGRLEGLAIRSTIGRKPSRAVEDMRSEPIRENIEVGAIVALAAQYADGVIVRVEIPRHPGEVERVDHDELQLA